MTAIRGAVGGEGLAPTTPPPPQAKPAARRLTDEALSLLGEAARRIAAALAIHRPCHDASTEPWSCQHGHIDEACTTGIPDVPAVCVECTDGNEDHLPYPCPPARALGALPIAPLEDIQHDQH